MCLHDPQITAFLSCWSYDELWHGEACSDFLRSYGIEEPIEPRLPDFAAIHTMWGAVNELTTLTGYAALIRRSDRPVLHQLLRK